MSEQNFLTEIECENLARKTCQDFITNCNAKNLDDAKMASQKLLAVAYDMFETMHDENVKMEVVQ